jgi:hypothetical protein
MPYPIILGGDPHADEHPLVAVAYQRWSQLPRLTVLAEMAILFHLAVQIDRVVALDRIRPAKKEG